MKDGFYEFAYDALIEAIFDSCGRSFYDEGIPMIDSDITIMKVIKAIDPITYEHRVEELKHKAEREKLAKQALENLKTMKEDQTEA